MGILIDTLLGLSFAGSLFALWYRFSQKIPELAQVPDEVISGRLKDESAKFRFFILHIKTFYKERLYKDWSFNLLGKTLYKFHILILRFDNGVVSLLKKIKISNGVANFFNGVQEKSEERETALPEINPNKAFFKHGGSASGTNMATTNAEDRKKYWQKMISDENRTGRSNRVEEVRMNAAKRLVKRINPRSAKSKHDDPFYTNASDN